MNHHNTEPARPASSQASAITLKWHPTGRHAADHDQRYGDEQEHPDASQDATTTGAFPFGTEPGWLL
jgi:hypothetical protein